MGCPTKVQLIPEQRFLQMSAMLPHTDVRAVNRRKLPERRNQL
ncbi:MAG: hypothetical protein V1790_11745 [Planctomycetota bacterium]